MPTTTRRALAATLRASLRGLRAPLRALRGFLQAVAYEPQELPLAAAAQRLRGRPGRPRKHPLTRHTPGTPTPGDRMNGGPDASPLAGKAPARSPSGASPITQRLLSLRQAAAYLSVSRWTVSDWLRAGVLPAVHLPGARLLRLDLADLDDLIARSRRQQSLLN